MKLLRIELKGEYKGLHDQSFDFSDCDGNLIAFIGLNGSGKSHLLELIAESFAYLERLQRRRGNHSNPCIKPLGFVVNLQYQIKVNYQNDIEYRIILGEANHILCFEKTQEEEKPITLFDCVLPAYVIGYASGLHENLQRAFMKNAVQFYETARVKRARLNDISQSYVNEEALIEINKQYLQKYPNIFHPSSFGLSPPSTEEGLYSLDESDTPIPAMVFMDYDCISLLMTSLSILNDDELDQLLPDIKYHLPKLIKLRYAFNSEVISEDAVKDIKLLIRVSGNHCNGLGKRTSDKQFELYELEYFSGTITLDISNALICNALREAHYNDPLAFFKRLYKLQLLGVANWRGDDRRALSKDNFFGAIKKPIKSKLPISVDTLKLSDKTGHSIDFDDLSDGEAQLIEILAAIRLFKEQEVLFLFDEPETHLNPAWRTHFHQHLERAMGEKTGAQLFVSSHSPFMISSLKSKNVFCFESTDKEISVFPATNETYGASFDVLIKQYFHLRSSISQTAVQDIKLHLTGNHEKARKWIENTLGDSMEKAYLLQKLKS